MSHGGGRREPLDPADIRPYLRLVDEAAAELARIYKQRITDITFDRIVENEFGHNDK